MSKKKLSKLLALYLPYVVIGLLATNLGEAWRLAVGKELGDKIVSLMDTLPAAFSNPLPSLHLFDLFIGLCCGAGMRLAVYLKGKNAKKYRHGMEYGSARWGTPKDIEPFMAPKFEDNIILTKTERLMMSNRPPDPKNPRYQQITERIPANRWGTGDDMKGACIFLASHASDYLGGAIIPVDGGYLVK